MTSGRIFIAGLFVLIFGGAICSTSDCSDAPQTMDDGCTLSDDCSTITCKMYFDGNSITFKLKINKCDDPVSVTASMDVPDLGIKWSHKYSSDDVIAVPGFSAFSAGVFVQVDITNNEETLHLKVKLLAGAAGIYPVKVTLVEGDLSISTDDCGFFGWFIDLSLPAKIAVIAGTVIFLISICCCCCCYFGCRRRRSTSTQHVIVTPVVGSDLMTTSTKSRVPMRPLVEEE